MSSSRLSIRASVCLWWYFLYKAILISLQWQRTQLRSNHRTLQLYNWEPQRWLQTLCYTRVWALKHGMGTLFRWMSPSIEAQHTPNPVATVLPPAPNYREEPALKFLAVMLVPPHQMLLFCRPSGPALPAVLCWDVITVISRSQERKWGQL